MRVFVSYQVCIHPLNGILFYQKACIQRRISEHLVSNIYENASILKEEKTIIISEFLQNALQFFLCSFSSSLRPATLIKTILRHSRFPLNFWFLEVVENLFFIEHLPLRLLLLKQHGITSK